MNDLERYRFAESLERRPSEATARQLIAMLAETEELTLSEAPAPYDVEPVYGRVAEAARISLQRMPAFGVPAIIEALPSATVDIARVLFAILNDAPVEQRMALPDEAHAAIESAAQKLGPRDAAHARFERDFARRVRAGELPTPEAFWRAWLAHPTRALVSIYELGGLVEDRAAFARELASWFDHPELGKYPLALCSALAKLPDLLPEETVRALASSEHPRRQQELVPILAAYGEPAAALVPLCIEMLRNEPLEEDERWSSRHVRWERATKALVDLADEIDSPHLKVLYAMLTEMAATPGRYQQCGARLDARLSEPTWER